jgi:hypothetical protein
MPYPYTSRAYGMQHKPKRRVVVPSFDEVVIDYPFTEGQATNNISMNNILFDSKNPAGFGSELVTNEIFTGTYVAGVAPDWSVDVGVVATESTNDIGGKAQRVSNMNGVGQGLQGTALSLTSGNIYVIEIDVKRISGTGNLQLQVDGMNGMTGTYDIPSASIPTVGIINAKFYAVANSATSTVTITADDTSLEVDIDAFLVKEVTGGNHMVMDFDLYDQGSRSSNSYDFNGIDEFFYIEDSRQDGLDFADKFTFATVVKPGAITSAATVFSKRRRLPAGRSYTMHFINATLRTIRMITSSNGTLEQNYRHIQGLTFPETKFRYICGNFNAGVGQFNVDDRNQNLSYSAGPPLAVTSAFDSATRVAIGASFGGLTPINAELFFLGEIGRMIVWKGAALSETERLQVFDLIRPSYGI